MSEKQQLTLFEALVAPDAENRLTSVALDRQRIQAILLNRGERILNCVLRREETGEYRLL